MDRQVGRIGFTLAEVLITLGIIGVVAAMTIPTLMNYTQDKEFKEAAKEAFSKSSQAIQQMKNDEGGTLSGYGINNAGLFKPVFMKYFKVIKDCNLSDCVAGSYTSDVYTSLSGDPADTQNGAEGQFVTSDGMFFNIQDSIYSGIYIIVDVNGYSKKPNIYGRDTFVFQIVNDNLLPMGANGTQLSSSWYCDKGDAHNLTSSQGLGCMYNVMKGANY